MPRQVTFLSWQIRVNEGLVRTWLIEDNAQVHPEGADSGGHKGEGLRMESLRKVALVLEVGIRPCLTEASHPKSLTVISSSKSWR